MEIHFSGVPTVTHEVIQANVDYAHTLGLPTFADVKATSKRLAIVGGGPSILDHVAELSAFDGDVWAINGAWRWCKDNGINARFFTVDPDPIVNRWIDGVDKALLCSRVDGKVFDRLREADVVVFDVSSEGGVAAGSSTAMCAPVLAAAMGYDQVVFYGCESSYPKDKSHAYAHEVRADEMSVVCNGQEFRTAPDYYIQVQELSGVIREFPRHFSERSGGLLRAMIADPKHDIIAVSRSLMAALEPLTPAAHVANREVLGSADNLEAFGISA
jgi:hypothetical protein